MSKFTTGRNSVRQIGPGMFFGGVEVSDSFFNGIVSPKIQSRLVCHCVICKHKGSRNNFYRPLPGKVPGFTDRCPNCGSNDIDVFDPDVYYRGNVAHEGSRLDE